MADFGKECYKKWQIRSKTEANERTNVGRKGELKVHMKSKEVHQKI
jgi:hypothetical protein